jgi:hypothetical protein
MRTLWTVALITGGALLGLSGCSKGSCASTPKGGAGMEFCTDNIKKSDCEKPSPLADHAFDSSRTCEQRGYKLCKLPKVWFKSCGMDRGSCVGVFGAGARIRPGMPREYCLENQTRHDCERPSKADVKYTFDEAKTCVQRGYPLTCVGGKFPASTRWATCPEGLTPKK